jgi:branched-chain amino acid transport system ATP-binding protein
MAIANPRASCHCVIAQWCVPPHVQAIFARLTVRENLQVGTMADRKGGQRIDQVLALFWRVGERMSQQAGTLSGGERKMLVISRALLGGPKLLKSDEPIEGVWHGLVEGPAERLKQLAGEIAVLIAEQHAQ